MSTADEMCHTTEGQLANVSGIGKEPAPSEAANDHAFLHLRMLEIVRAADSLRLLLGYAQARQGVLQSLPPIESVDDLIRLAELIAEQDDVAAGVQRYIAQWHEDRDFDRRLVEDRPAADRALQVFIARRDDLTAEVKDRAVAAYHADLIEESRALFGGAVINLEMMTESGQVVKFPDPGVPHGAAEIEGVTTWEHQGRRYVLLLRPRDVIAAAIRQDADGSLHAVSYWSDEWLSLSGHRRCARTDDAELTRQAA